MFFYHRFVVVLHGRKLDGHFGPEIEVNYIRTEVFMTHHFGERCPKKRNKIGRDNRGLVFSGTVR